ncbi:GerAB/ArcD/ProY family transporter [Alkalibaculum sporogenes]|nr:GerAB/ArcD/ProY family transporter [Alkalibaculum sporogenes]
MEKRKGKIGINTAFIMFLIIVFSPSARIFGTYTALKADQAGWLSPIVAFLVMAYLVIELNNLFVKFPSLSLMEIYEKVTGKILAKVIALVYLIWIIILTGLNLKSYTMRLSTAVYPNIQENIFLIITLVIIGGLIVKAGFVVASRMFKIFFWITALGFFVLCGVLFPNISINKLTPISYLDIIPIFEGSIAIIAIWSYITLLFIMSENIIGMKYFKKRGLQIVGYLYLAVTLLLVCLIGNSGSYVLSRSTFPYLLTVEQMILLETITGLEAILVVLWILSDFALVTVLILTSLKLVKYIFNLEDTTMFTNLVTIIAFYTTNLIANNYYTMRDFSYNYVYMINIIIFIIIPVLMSWFNKLRTKAQKALAKNSN